MDTVELPEPIDESAAVETDPNAEIEPGQPRARESRVLTQAEIDEADGTADTAESDGRDAEPDSPARI